MGSKNLVLAWLAVLCVSAVLLSQRTHANTFIWDPSSPGNIDTWKRPYPSFANPPVCVTIPANMSLCYGITYTEMRLPNLLHHDSLNEVIEQSESWNQLTKLKCHSDTQLFLCSMFTPVCLDQTIPPCRSLCEAVQRSCEPYMLKHGFNWPSMMRCDQFPVDNNMCIQSQSSRPSATPDDSSIHPWPKVTLDNAGQDSNQRENQADTKLQDDKFYRNFLDVICKSEWVIKSGVNNMQANQVRIKKYKVIYGNLALQAPFSVVMNESASAITDSNTNFKRRHKFVIVGVGNGKERSLSARFVVSWHNNTAQIKKAIKKAKTGNVCLRKGRGRDPTKVRRQNRNRHSNRN